MWTSDGGWGAELAPLGVTHRLPASEVEALGPFVQGQEPSQVPSCCVSVVSSGCVGPVDPVNYS